MTFSMQKVLKLKTAVTKGGLADGLHDHQVNGSYLYSKTCAGVSCMTQCRAGKVVWI